HSTLDTQHSTLDTQHSTLNKKSHPGGWLLVGGAMGSRGCSKGLDVRNAGAVDGSAFLSIESKEQALLIACLIEGQRLFVSPSKSAPGSPGCFATWGGVAAERPVIEPSITVAGPICLVP